MDDEKVSVGLSGGFKSLFKSLSDMKAVASMQLGSTKAIHQELNDLFTKTENTLKLYDSILKSMDKKSKDYASMENIVNSVKDYYDQVDDLIAKFNSATQISGDDADKIIDAMEDISSSLNRTPKELKDKQVDIPVNVIKDITSKYLDKHLTVDSKKAPLQDTLKFLNDKKIIDDKQFSELSDKVNKASTDTTLKNILSEIKFSRMKDDKVSITLNEGEAKLNDLVSSSKHIEDVLKTPTFLGTLKTAFKENAKSISVNEPAQIGFSAAIASAFGPLGVAVDEMLGVSEKLASVTDDIAQAGQTKVSKWLGDKFKGITDKLSQPLKVDSAKTDSKVDNLTDTVASSAIKLEKTENKTVEATDGVKDSVNKVNRNIKDQPEEIAGKLDPKFSSITRGFKGFTSKLKTSFGKIAASISAVAENGGGGGGGILDEAIGTYLGNKAGKVGGKISTKIGGALAKRGGIIGKAGGLLTKLGGAALAKSGGAVASGTVKAGEKVAAEGVVKAGESVAAKGAATAIKAGGSVAAGGVAGAATNAVAGGAGAATEGAATKIGSKIATDGASPAASAAINTGEKLAANTGEKIATGVGEKVAGEGAAKAIGGVAAKGIGGKIPIVGGLISGGITLAQGGSKSEAAGSAVGTTAGSMAGAWIGGILGSVVPGLGTAIGAAAGSIIGGIAGDMIGSKVGKTIGDKLDEKDATEKRNADADTKNNDAIKAWKEENKNLLDPEAFKKRMETHGPGATTDADTQLGKTGVLPTVTQRAQVSSTPTFNLSGASAALDNVGKPVAPASNEMTQNASEIFDTLKEEDLKRKPPTPEDIYNEFKDIPKPDVPKDDVTKSPFSDTGSKSVEDSKEQQIQIDSWTGSLSISKWYGDFAKTPERQGTEKGFFEKLYSGASSFISSAWSGIKKFLGISETPATGSSGAAGGAQQAPGSTTAPSHAPTVGSAAGASAGTGTTATNVQSKNVTGDTSGGGRYFQSGIASKQGYKLGDISSMYESGGNAGLVGKIAGDKGGYSYGAFQLASGSGGPEDFLKSQYGQKYASQFQGLGSSKDGGAFKSKWEEIAKNDPDGFKDAQRSYALDKYLSPMKKQAAGYGLNLDDRSQALQEQMLHAAMAAPAVGKKSLANIASKMDLSKASDSEIMDALHAEITKPGADGQGLANWSSQSASTQKSVKNAWDLQQKDFKKLLALEQNGGLTNVAGKSDTGKPATGAQAAAGSATATTAQATTGQQTSPGQLASSHASTTVASGPSVPPASGTPPVGTNVAATAQSGMGGTGPSGPPGGIESEGVPSSPDDAKQSPTDTSQSGASAASGASPSAGSIDKSGFKAGGGANIDKVNSGFLNKFAQATAEYKSKTGKVVQVTDGWRSLEAQQKVAKEKPGLAAKPGKSIHGYGFALDANSADLTQMDKMGILSKYGLTRPMSYEPWHVEPVGLDKAALRASGPSGVKDGNQYSSALAGGTPAPESGSGGTSKNLAQGDTNTGNADNASQQMASNDTQASSSSGSQLPAGSFQVADAGTSMSDAGMGYGKAAASSPSMGAVSAPALTGASVQSGMGGTGPSGPPGGIESEGAALASDSNTQVMNGSLQQQFAGLGYGQVAQQANDQSKTMQSINLGIQGLIPGIGALLGSVSSSRNQLPLKVQGSTQIPNGLSNITSRAQVTGEANTGPSYTNIASKAEQVKQDSLQSSISSFASQTSEALQNQIGMGSKGVGGQSPAIANPGRAAPMLKDDMGFILINSGLL